MPMTSAQRQSALDDLKGAMTRRFKTNLSEHDLFFARQYAAQIAAQHHDENLHESVVVHVDVVPYRNDTHVAVLEYGSATRYAVTVKDGDGNVIRDLGETAPGMGGAVVFALKALRVPARLKSTRLVSCGICGHYHPTDFNGDCRDDGNRFPTPNDSDDVATHYDNGDPGDDIGDNEDDQEHHRGFE